ncbi:polysaccharide biosynthesis protein [Acidaminobacter sp. JC074]|uniref:putative polysaccharide biosynthesis protein n=1 Tax=Acidaminobacter sp. JC074 TaxID=2530199 RepID=UPI001F0D13C4|nr:polysaccharide biosynthesis protein [Acidaminobacter sp. JC074]MCH4890677.1 polysaccharide biosynthesis protein [Acidaminobacter sp. JC074]
MRDNTKKNSFIKGATILGLAGIFIKILGAAFKLPLFNWIGAEGTSYYMAPYPIYNWLLVVSTAGIPTAIARLIAEKETEGDTHGIFGIINAIVKPIALISVVIFAILFFGAEPISAWVGLPESAIAFKTIAPALLFVPLMSVFRGFFQGVQKMQGFAITQIVEQLVRVIVGLTLGYVLWFTMAAGPAKSAAGATFGASAGAIVGFVVAYSIYKYMKSKYYSDALKLPNQHKVDGSWDIFKQVLIISIPITIGASIMPTMNSIDLMLVVRRLNDIGVENAKELYGILTGFAVTIVNFPQILTASLQISLVPAVTQMFVIYDKSKSEDDRKHLSDTVNAGIKTALIIGVPCAIGLVTLAEPVMLLLYSSQKESAIIGGSILAVLGWDLIFLAVYQATTGILQGIKKQMLPALNLGIGMIFKVVLTYVLVGNPVFGINGAAISTVVAFAVASGLNVWSLARLDYLDLNIVKLSIKPVISGLVMGAFVWVAYNPIAGILGGKLATLVTIMVAAVIYGILIIMTKTLSHEEYDMLPGGSKLRKLAEKLGR